MTTLAHISDLHFGREDPALVEGLREALWDARPDILVVSGDLTQRAKKRQFKAARAFLEAIPQVPRVVVPGNHDVSATNMFERVVQPLKRYKRYITEEMAPFLEGEDVAIAGIDTVRLMSTKDGRINRAQVEAVCARFSGVDQRAVRVVVTHHPIDVPAEDLKHPTLTRAKMAVSAFAGCGIDLFLSGHLHGGLSLLTSVRYPVPGYSAVVVHAGTAVSTRTREEPNGFNLIQVAADQIDVEPLLWSGKRFRPEKPARYTKASAGWSRVQP